MASEHPEVTQLELSVLFCDDPFIQKLNASYRGKDKATDVLSFSAIEEQGEFIVGDNLGDLVISIPTSLCQAKKYQVTPQQEVLRLLIHGLLHLFGYAHELVARSVAQRMRRKEQSLFRKYQVLL